jgi:hypothetical protein
MKKFCLIALTAFAVLLASCGPSAAKPTTTPAALGDFPVGNFSNSTLAWTWDFKADGSYSSGGPQAAEHGTFTVAGDQISIKGDYCGNIIGTYTWAYDGTALTFQGIHDECTDRAGVVVTGKWVKKP